MSNQHPVTYYCKECGEPFLTEQGSQRRYCNACTLALITAGIRRGGQRSLGTKRRRKEKPKEA